MPTIAVKAPRAGRRAQIGALALASLLAAGAAAHAGPSTYSTTQVIANEAVNHSDGSPTGAPVSTTTLNAYTSGGGASSNGSATSSAAIGSLKVRADASSTSAGAGSAGATSAVSYADARWTDTIVVTGGTVGTKGYITALMIADGLASASISPGGDSNSFSYGGVNLTLVGTGFSPQGYVSNYTASGSITDPIGTIALKIPVYFGFDTDLGYQLTATASSYAYNFFGYPAASADLSLDYSHTVKWGGITGVFDADGNPIRDFSVASASSFDYVMAPTTGVPEPAVWMLMIGGFALAGATVRGKRRAAAAA